MNNKAGYITLISVLLVGVVGLAITTSMLLLGLGSARSSLTLTNSYLARTLADSCAEVALDEVRQSLLFATTTGALSFVRGNCTYSVIAGAGEARTVYATGTVDTVIRKEKITVDRVTPTIHVTSWLESGSF